MAFYLVTAKSGNDLVNGVKNVVIEGNSSTEAKHLCDALVGSDGAWSGATVTTLSAGASTDYVGWKYRVVIGKSAAFPSAIVGANVVDVSYTAVASDTTDLIGAALVTALNATAQIAGSAYNTGTNVLTVAETTDDMGDSTVRVEITPKGCLEPLPAGDLYSALTHQGAHGAALKVTLTAAAVIPTVVATV